MSLEGKLADLSLPDIFQILSLSKRSGILTILRKEGTARLVFRQGNIVYASSDSRSRLGFTLVSKGIITTEELEDALQAQSRCGGAKPLGTVLIEANVISKKVLEEEITKHVCVVVSELLRWENGTFHFELGELVDHEGTVPLKEGVNTDFILLESARIKDEEDAGMGEPALPEPGFGNTSATKTGRAGGVEVLDDMKILTSMIAELSGPSSRSEITLMVLRFASEIMNRAVIFLVRRSDVVGLGQFGVVFPDPMESDLQIRSVIISLSEDSVFRHVVKEKLAYKGVLEKNPTNSFIVEKLGNEWPGEVFVAPLVADDKVVAILYGDNIPKKNKVGKTEGLEAFIRVAGVSLGKTLLERKLRESQEKAAR